MLFLEEVAVVAERCMVVFAIENTILVSDGRLIEVTASECSKRC